MKQAQNVEQMTGISPVSVEIERPEAPRKAGKEKDPLAGVKARELFSPAVFLFYLLLLILAIFFGAAFVINTSAAGDPFALLSHRLDSLTLLILGLAYFLALMLVGTRHTQIIREHVKGSKQAQSKQGAEINKNLKRQAGRGRLTWLWASYQHYMDFDGLYYLPRLFLNETIDSGVHIYTYSNIFSCNMSLHWTLSFVLLFIADASFKVYTLGCSIFVPGDKCKKNFRCLTVKTTINTERRNVHIACDIILSVITTVVPVAIMYMEHGIRLRNVELIIMTVPPGISCFLKLRRYVIELLRGLGDQIILKNERKNSVQRMRRRMSLYGETRASVISAKQLVYFPWSIRLLFLVLNAAIFLFWTCIMFAYFSVNASFQNVCIDKYRLSKEYGNVTGGSEDLWLKGCLLKVPFCQRYVTASCDCAKFQIIDHKVHELPESISDMRSLRFFKVNNGPLRALPSSINELTWMIHFEVRFSDLRIIPVDFNRWKDLRILYLDYNKIEKYNENSLWTHQNIAVMRLNDNYNLRPPTQIKPSMPKLQFLSLVNNSAVYRTSKCLDCTYSMNTTAILLHQDASSFPLLTNVHLSGNSFDGGSLPTSLESYKSTLRMLAVARCGLSLLPDYFKNFENLVYLDLRGNNISDVKGKFPAYKDSIDINLSGNPYCLNPDNAQSSWCKASCTEFCSFGRARRSGDGFCDFSCNAPKCNYDGGDCL